MATTAGSDVTTTGHPTGPRHEKRALLELTEYQTLEVGKDQIAEAAGEYLYRHHGSQIEVETPSFKTAQKWQLTSKGWVGFLPVDETLSLSLRPKVPLASLFRMLDYAYKTTLKLPPGIFDAASIEEYCEHLSSILAKRVIDRARVGFYRSYVPRRDKLPFVRGTLELRRALRRPWDVSIPCAFDDHTSDLEDNRILAWTLFLICRSGFCSNEIQSLTRQAFQAVRGACQLRPVSARACIGRQYDRLNADYEPMHGLCRFFLDHLSPTQNLGDRRMLPFLVEMSALFEQFVAGWLQEHLPASYTLKAQHTVHLDAHGKFQFRIDLVIYDSDTGRPLMVLDTKYKAPSAPTGSDIEQVVAYAESLGCDQAALVYPTDLEHPVDTHVGRIRVRSLPFHLSGDLDQNGRSFLAAVT